MVSHARANRLLDLGALLIGIGAMAALLGGALMTPEVLRRCSPDGVLSWAFRERLIHLRLLASCAGAVALAAACWRRLGAAEALVALWVGLTWTAALTQRLYPRHLLAQPARLLRTALGEELLLSEYAPRPHLVVPAHEVAQARYPAINIHAHFRYTGTQRTPEEMLAIMDACGVRMVADLDGVLGETLRQEMERFASADPQRLLIFAQVAFGESLQDWSEFQRAVEALLQAKRSGAKGLKIWKNLGLRTRDERGALIPVDDPRLEALWETMGALRLPILIHLADPQAFFQPVNAFNERYEELAYLQPDWSFADPRYPRPAQILAQFERVLERHRNTQFIGAHLMSLAEDLGALGQMLERHPNLSVDISARANELGRQPVTARRFFVRYADRILFGTDGNPDETLYRGYFRFLETEDEYFEYPRRPGYLAGRWRIYGLHLPDDVLRKVYHDNAARLLGLGLLGLEGRP